MISVTWTGIISIGKDNTDFDITQEKSPLPSWTTDRVNNMHSRRMYTARLETVPASASVATTRCHSGMGKSPNEQVWIGL